ncbi:MAG: monofunctional biosynthetic peptidoglycan transglycosylase [Paracoccus sp. (in: a-proteobacteria)]|jgi:monofunctional biosynthetic peptidoglycan transglycosylase|uniref:monofunctional biosynthetic peptidoglycan transglycosylase n=1 Tax=unclassified Paracoccus (in: a-proteobacteria) TaxID=2688777 RepID=UPI000C6C019B|nr:monofunctional biosynthetic peptidoglycan transglycosylase [Paracoccus sp. (in: a-proteobacteria)]MBA49807.1 monofunctional biosynthetic peptidoglycan transglycosylase [Paracoccus sp. (in: a-proteobacteria)]|tara:strand:+ start:5717 stop:6445 length:729 start_codon:yes stop_codon:yes gene_type:complete
MILRALIRPPAADPADPRPGGRRRWRPLRRLAVWMRWFALRVFVLMAMLVGIYAFINPPTTLTIVGEARKRPITPRVWVDLGDVSPQMRRAVVAAEDANFCRHWGFDMDEIRRVVASGSSRGASTISQQTAKNVFLWQGRSWPRKALETVFTPLIEAFWSKRRILEVYLNLAEFGPGVFGIGAAAREFYGTTPDRLDAVQAARLAAVLPSPKTRDPRQASARSRSIADGAATIRRDGRADCF